MSLPNTITVRMQNHAFMYLECEPHQNQELRDFFSFYVPFYKFMPAYKRKVWDGKIRLFNAVTRELNVGLWAHLKKFCADRMYPLQIEDNAKYGHPEKKNTVKHPTLVKFLNSIESPFEVGIISTMQSRTVFKTNVQFFYHLLVVVSLTSSIIYYDGI